MFHKSVSDSERCILYPTRARLLFTGGKYELVSYFLDPFPEQERAFVIHMY